MRKIVYYLFFIGFVCFSCGRKQNNLEDALQMAGDNGQKK